MNTEAAGQRTGTDLLIDVLRSEGVRHVFGNPGTTELPLVDALAVTDDIDYVLGLHEQTVVGIADGYAQATGRPAFVNLHATAGLGNAMGALVNATAHAAPMVVTAGNQDVRHLIADPLLGGDLVGLAAPTTKWAHEVRTVGELGIVLRRAFNDAGTGPAGPVFVGLRTSTLDEPGAPPAPPRSRLQQRTAADGIEELASLLAQTPLGRLAIVAGDEVATSGAVENVVALAETLGAPVFAAPLHSKAVFPPRHALYAGLLPPAASVTRRRLAGFDRVLYLGGHVFTVYPYTSGSPVPEGVDLVQISADTTQLGRTHPVGLGVAGDIRSTVALLLPVLRDRVEASAAKDALESARTRRTAEISQLEEQARAGYAAVPADPLAAVHGALRAAPADTIVVDESSTANQHVRDLHQWVNPGSFYCNRGGGLGWAMAAAVGVSLGHEREKSVLTVVGDGAALYTPQALWSAARERTPVVYLVLDNQQYLILKNNLRFRRGPSVERDRFVAMDLVDPTVDHVALAQSFGVEATRVADAAGVADAADAAFASGRPHVIVVPVAG